MTIELMVFALWVAAIFLVFWQIVISIQFSRISGDLKVAGQEIEEGWNFSDIERLCQTIASEMGPGHEVLMDHPRLHSCNSFLHSGLEQNYNQPHSNFADNNECYRLPLPLCKSSRVSNPSCDNNHEFVDTEDYLKYLESRIDSLENLVDRESMADNEEPDSVNMSAGHFVPHMTQYGQEFNDSYGHEFNDKHSIQPLKVAANDWPTPVRLRRVR